MTTKLARRFLGPIAGAGLALLLAWSAGAEDAAPAVVPDAVRQTFLRLMEEKRYPEAAEIATQRVELTRQRHGERSAEHTAALTDLAQARLQLGQLFEAETGFRAAIELIERDAGPASERLLEPLIGLGDTFMRGGFYPSANDAYQRALVLNHASAGFYNLEQNRILDGLSESYLALDKLSEANARQRIQVSIQERRSGGAHPDVAQALFKLARWYNRTGQYAESRNAWQQARRVIRESGGETAPTEVDALIGEALSYANEGEAPATVSTLKRALDLIDAMPEPDRARRAEVLVTMGDLYVVFRRPKNARQHYSRAWQELSADETLTAKREEYFGKPSRISGPRLPDIVGAERNAADELAAGYVVASLGVDADGSARDPVVIESEPPGLLDQQVLKALGGTAFRPRLADGEAVFSGDVQFRHDFRYPRRAGASGDAPAESAPAGEKGAPIAYPGERDAASGG